MAQFYLIVRAGDELIAIQGVSVPAAQAARDATVKAVRDAARASDDFCQ
jgi:hypothetical protein